MELSSPRVLGTTDCNIHKGLTVVLGPIFQGTNQGGSTALLVIQPDYPIVRTSNLSECCSRCTVAARWPTIYLWQGFKGAYGAFDIPKSYVEDSSCTVLSNVLLLEGVLTGVIKESNRHDHLLYFLCAFLPKSAGLCTQWQIPWFKDAGTRL